jgi:methylphosphotriester-DNA--protein-cysteine methyltransferase
MTFIRHPPSAALSRWVDCLWYSAGEPGPQHSAARSALPTGAMDVVFNLAQDSFEVLLPDGKTLRTDGAIVHGAQSGYFIIAARHRGASAGIHFRPGGGAALLGMPATQLRNQHLPLADLWGVRAAQLRTQLLHYCNEPARIFHALEQALLAQSRQLRQQPEPLVHPAISFALRSFAANSGLSRITPIQESTGYSARRFNTLFQHAVGLPPKLYCRIQRLRAVIEQLARGVPVEWAKLAADNGYFDQSHLNRDFRLFSGVTPGQYRPASADSALHMRLPDELPAASGPQVQQ